VGDDNGVRRGAHIGVEGADQRGPDPCTDQWAAMNGRTDAGAIPAKVLEKIRPMVTAGLANDVEEVYQYAAPM
jgi:hypothetical protein